MNEIVDDGLNELNRLNWRAFERTLRARNRSVHTIATYLKVWRRFAAHSHPDADLAEAKYTDIEDYLGKMLETGADTTAAIHFRHLRAMYNWFVLEDIIDESPMRRLKEPKVTDVPPPVLDDFQLTQLLGTCSTKSFVDLRDMAIIRLWCEPGSPRVAEMAGMERDALDMRRDQVRVHGKGNKIRDIPFGAKTGSALDRYLRVRAKHAHATSPALWLGKFGPMTGSGLWQMLNRRAARAGIEHVHPHQLRHTSAHVWFDSDGSESDAMELFGWSSPDMPRRYGRSARTARAQRASRRISPADRL